MSEIHQTGIIAPPIDADSGWWWDAVADHKLMLPRCGACGKCFFPPQPTCPYCGSTEWAPTESSGEATVYSWVVVHLALDPAFEHDVPYTIVAAELAEGPRIFGRLAGDLVEAGMALRVTFYTVGDVTLVGFLPAS